MLNVIVASTLLVAIVFFSWWQKTRCWAALLLAVLLWWLVKDVEPAHNQYDFFLNFCRVAAIGCLLLFIFSFPFGKKH